ncbi:AzlD domain-containing protein [Phyllobacterium leguminum]|uniref:Branched-subunit amino acid transport protein AzlD n=1 Tax=Phyllobacterium leguminum TaxID=314237 RepID=A0A318T2T1_9HYPH|nr:AzlD domain-containing protein [Phyllobacterium leguminum]PYE88179.1 branched-subunit amino acid transport protein AzlD [Phyllobacterium leguminum]
MTWTSLPDWWWPFLFILIGGWLATDVWRFLGVFVGGRIREDSEALVLVRCIATALVAAVIAQLILYPTGTLASSPVWLRVAAAAIGFTVYLATGKRILVGVAVAEVLLVIGLMVL